MPLLGFAPTVAAAGRRHAGLARRLRKLGRVFDLAALRGQPLGSAEVVDYYDACHDAYRKYHSAEGAVHMALNDGGRFDPDGYRGQLRRIESAWAAEGGAPADVLELAFGQGYNLAWLAPRHPGSRFAGVDFTPAHVRIAAERVGAAGLANVALLQADFHALPFRDAAFDSAFCIESMCHAQDLPRALAEAARVLRPGGALTLFDGYRLRPPEALDDDQALAVELVARGMAIEQLQLLGALLDAARGAGFEVDAVEALDAEVLPSLRRLERITGAVIRFPWLGRRALARRHPMRGRNVLAGYLMHSVVALGLVGYRRIVLRKPR